jgi:glycosyl transferase family 2
VKRPSISVVVPTIGRPSLLQALRSISSQMGPDDEVLVSGDGPQPLAREITAQFGAGFKYMESDSRADDWGATPRNAALDVAAGDAVAFMDDDDVSLPGALDAVRRGLEENPGRPLIFMMRHRGRLIWERPELFSGNVSSQMFAVPNVPGRVGRWTTRYEGDFDFITSTLALYPEGSVVFREEVIAELRDHATTPGAPAEAPASPPRRPRGGKAIAYYALHYGKEYLAWSVRSVQDAVDEIHVLYTDVPSYGHAAGAPCPDSEEELAAEAGRFCRKPLFWHRGRWPTEREHRNAVLPIARGRGATQVLLVDADEVWAPGQAAAAMDAAGLGGQGRTAVSFRHFWRSFKWSCVDGTRFSRVFNLAPDGRIAPGDAALPAQAWPVFHFGYAQSPEITRYKWTCHGHQRDLRPRWLEERFIAWRPGARDVHPVCGRGFWNPEPTDGPTRDALRSVLADHPYWGLDLIEVPAPARA